MGSVKQSFFICDNDSTVAKVRDMSQYMLYDFILLMDFYAIYLLHFKIL